MQRITRILLVLMVCCSLASAQTVVPYRLLSSRESAPGSIKEFDYNVSVDQNLDVAAVKRVICQVVQSEKPVASEVLSIGIYFKLNEYIPENERDVKDSAEHRAHRIAQYHWNKDSPKDSRRLVLTKDSKGQSLSDWRFYDFNHEKSCR